MGDIMNSKKLRKIKEALEGIKKSPSGRTFNEFKTIAGQLGRVRVNRGKEPTFEKVGPPPLPVLTIPGHPSDLKQGTARQIAFSLLNDCDEWELYLQSQESQL